MCAGCAALFLLACKDPLGMCAAKGRAAHGDVQVFCVCRLLARAGARAEVLGRFVYSATLCRSIGPTQRSAFPRGGF